MPPHIPAGDKWRKTQLKQIRETVLREIDTALRGIDEVVLSRAAKRILQAKTIFLHGRGREDIACRALCMRLNHLGLSAFHITDPCTPPITQQDLLLLSCAEALGAEEYALQTARQAGAQIVVATSSARKFTIPEEELAIQIPVLAHSVQPYGAVYEQVLWLVFDALEYLLQAEVGGDEQQRVSRHANIL